MNVNGMAIYSSQSSGNGHVGDSVTIRIRSDNGGTPGLLLFDFTASITAVDFDGSSVNPSFLRASRKFASFSDITLLANTNYWIGMMGTTIDIGQSALDGTGAPGASQMWMYQGGGGGYNLFNNQHFGDMAFRLYGDVTTPVPEPEIYTMMGIGLGLLGWVGRRRKLAT